MNNKLFTGKFIGLLVVVLIVGLYFFMSENSKKPIDNNVLPTPTGKEDLIKVTNPLPGSKVNSPLIVKGEARGYWFFEASFPIYITDWDGLIIGQGVATAQDDWMTENFVPFEAVVEFDTTKIRGQYSDRGTLILKKDNPSGLPENDDALEIEIKL